MRIFHILPIKLYLPHSLMFFQNVNVWHRLFTSEMTESFFSLSGQRTKIQTEPSRIMFNLTNICKYRTNKIFCTCFNVAFLVWECGKIHCLHNSRMLISTLFSRQFFFFFFLCFLIKCFSKTIVVIIQVLFINFFCRLKPENV